MIDRSFDLAAYANVPEGPPDPICSDAYVDCDDDCRALLHPVTFEETQAALIHWREHGLLNGCSHGR